MNKDNALTPILTFGWKPDVVGNGALLTDGKIVFVANRLLVVYNEADHSQEISQLDERYFATALAVSQNRKLIAVSQYFPNQKPFVELFTFPFSKKTILKADVLEVKV